MKGVRGWALLAGVALTAVAVWQVVVYAGASQPVLASDLGTPPGEGSAPHPWLAFISETHILGKTWGARVAAMLLAIVPLRVLSERARGGWGSAARAFLYVWLPLAFVGLLLQTQPIERLRDLAAHGDPEITAATFTMWYALVEPLTRTSAVLGVAAFSMLLASVGGRSPVLGVLLLVVLVVLIVVLWSPVMEAVVALVQGVVLAVLAFAAPREADHSPLRR